MGKLKFKVHPLFIIFGIYFAFTGKVFSFISYTLCACIHELGHSLVAEKLGYRLKNVTLMPYGALVSGDMSGMSLAEECLVVIAGPLVNFLLGMLILGVWWVFPETYPYLELAAEANFALAAVNLIPAFPLDGGRLLLCGLSKIMTRSRAVKIAKMIGYAFSVALIGVFIYSCFSSVNFSALIFAVFLFLGALDKSAADSYVRVCDEMSVYNVKKAKEIKELAIPDTLTVKQTFRLLTGNCLYRLNVYSQDGKLKKVINPEDVSDYLTGKNINDKIA